MIKVNILWKFDTVGGGGNQFLRTLRRYFIENRVYEDDPYKANVVLVNSKDCLIQAANVKKSSNNKVVHRIDGIFKIYRGNHELYNDINVYNFARDYADGVIFQSKWSQGASYKNGMKQHRNQVIIINCADSKYFKKTGEKSKHNKVKLVTSSWSSNPKKGFSIYEFLDKNLDFTEFDYSFAGRSPLQFKNIVNRGILSSFELSKLLNDSDIFITATEDDACSNSIIEALSCGVVVVGLNSGGTPEIITSNNGEIFFSQEDVIDKINLASKKIKNDEYKITVSDISDVGVKYYEFMNKVCDENLL